MQPQSEWPMEKFNYLGQTFINLLVVTEYYHQNAEKNFLKYFDFQKEVDAYDISFFPRKLYIYKKGTTKIRQ